jgi:hypothetical protein
MVIMPGSASSWTTNPLVEWLLGVAIDVMELMQAGKIKM